METGGATLQDGLHELYIYKCEERAKLESLNYLSMPSNAREPNYPGTAVALLLLLQSASFCTRLFQVFFLSYESQRQHFTQLLRMLNTTFFLFLNPIIKAEYLSLENNVYH
jgi:hypothetical protein